MRNSTKAKITLVICLTLTIMTGLSQSNYSLFFLILSIGSIIYLIKERSFEEGGFGKLMNLHWQRFQERERVRQEERRHLEMITKEARAFETGRQKAQWDWDQRRKMYNDPTGIKRSGGGLAGALFDEPHRKRNQKRDVR